MTSIVHKNNFNKHMLLWGNNIWLNIKKWQKKKRGKKTAFDKTLEIRKNFHNNFFEEWSSTGNQIFLI